MMTARTELSAPLRALVDERLDAIDRVLLQVGVSRGERQDVVQEVEAQLFEMLARRSADEPAREDVLAVLAELDPPEAYAPEGLRHRLRSLRPAAAPQQPQPSLLALGSAFAAAATVLAPAAVVALEIDLDNSLGLLALVVMFGIVPLAVTACGFVSIARIRRSDGALFGLPAALFAAILNPLLLCNALLVVGVMVMAEIGMILVGGLALLAVNAFVVRYAWKLVSAGYQREQGVSRSYLSGA
jgi:hypothetical protein